MTFVLVLWCTTHEPFSVLLFPSDMCVFLCAATFSPEDSRNHVLVFGAVIVGFFCLLIASSVHQQTIHHTQPATAGFCTAAGSVSPFELKQKHTESRSVNLLCNTSLQRQPNLASPPACLYTRTKRASPLTFSSSVLPCSLAAIETSAHPALPLWAVWIDRASVSGALRTQLTPSLQS